MLIHINTSIAATAQDLILVIIFRADMGSSSHIDNKNKDILIFGEGLTQGLDNTTLTAEAIYPISFTQLNKRFVKSTL